MNCLIYITSGSTVFLERTEDIMIDVISYAFEDSDGERNEYIMDAENALY